MSLEDSTLHTVARTAVETLGGPVQSFTPVNQIHQHLSGIHCYAHDLTRQVTAEHYCSHLRPNLHQCVIYDSDEPNARLIGIEYIIDEATFESLDMEERRYWHSHNFEVESGMLTVVSKRGVPKAAMDAAERPILQDIRRTYGKTCHTWQVDREDCKDLPLGPPQMMMAFTSHEQIDESRLAERDQQLGISSFDKRQQRKEWLNPPPGEYTPIDGADHWEKMGEAIQLVPQPRKMKLKVD